MLKIFLLTAELFLFLFLPFVVQGASLSLVVNEIAWMGTAISRNNEWIELYNTRTYPINLDGWILKTGDNSLKINLSGIVPAKSFYLIKRANKKTMSNIKADLVYKGVLSNKGERLMLYDNTGNLIDYIDCSSGWFGGDNKTKQTMERINPFLSGNNAENWQTSQNPGGTPKAKNSAGKSKSAEKIAGTKFLQKRKKEFVNYFTGYPKGVIFSEILPSPKGPDAQNEWIEIQNKNNFEVDLSGWQIKDKKGKTAAYIFPAGTKISPLGYLILKRPKTKIILNNSGDGLDLFNPNKEVVDSVNFVKAPLNQSYNRTSKNNWKWSRFLTPGKKNYESKIEDYKNVKIEVGSAGKAKKSNKFAGKKETAAVGEKIPEPPKHFFVFFIALIVAIFSAITILILKKSITKNHNI